MLIKQKNWDKTLINNFKKYDLFAVSGRAAHDFRFINDKFEVINIFGREYPFSSNDWFGRVFAKIMSIFKFKTFALLAIMSILIACGGTDEIAEKMDEAKDVNDKTKGFQFLANINTSVIFNWNIKDLIKK